MEYPKYVHRESSAEEQAKDGSLYKSKLVQSQEEQDLLGEQYVELLSDIPKMKAKFGENDDEISAAAAKSSEEDTAIDEQDVAKMDADQLRAVLVKHGYSEKKLAKKSLEQLREIFSR